MSKTGPLSMKASSLCVYENRSFYPENYLKQGGTMIGPAGCKYYHFYDFGENMGGYGYCYREQQFSNPRTRYEILKERNLKS